MPWLKNLRVVASTRASDGPTALQIFLGALDDFGVRRLLEALTRILLAPVRVRGPLRGGGLGRLRLGCLGGFGRRSLDRLLLDRLGFRRSRSRGLRRDCA